MVSFYSLSGTFLGSRTYTEDGTYTDYVDMADIQTFDNRFILPRVWRDSAHDCNWGGKMVYNHICKLPCQGRRTLRT